MSKFPYYAIVNGNLDSKVCTSWEECVSFRSKNPSNAKYKGFHALYDAENWIADILGANTAVKIPHKSGAADAAMTYDPCTAIAYTDGSYNPTTKVYGYGVRMCDANDMNQNVRIFAGHGDIYSSARNVAGECDGAIRAVKEAIRLGYKKLIIRHDYVGVGAWVTGAWSRTNAPVSQNYKKVMMSYEPFINVTFEHVPGHTGEIYNEQVDQIAKTAVGLDKTNLLTIEARWCEEPERTFTEDDDANVEFMCRMLDCRDNDLWSFYLEGKPITYWRRDGIIHGNIFNYPEENILDEYIANSNSMYQN